MDARKRPDGFIFVRGIDPAVKHRFKVLCMQRGVTMAAEIERLVKAALDKAEKERVR